MAQRRTEGAPKRSAARQAPTLTPSAPENTSLSSEQRLRYIAEAAYFMAQRRGFAPGAELDDWLAAEAVVDRALSPEHTH